MNICHNIKDNFSCKLCREKKILDERSASYTNGFRDGFDAGKKENTKVSEFKEYKELVNKLAAKVYDNM